MSFVYPPLSLHVSSLVGVPDRAPLRADGWLTPQDIERDATLQTLTARNARLSKALVGALAAFVAMGLTAAWLAFTQHAPHAPVAARPIVSATDLPAPKQAAADPITPIASAETPAPPTVPGIAAALTAPTPVPSRDVRIATPAAVIAAKAHAVTKVPNNAPVAPKLGFVTPAAPQTKVLQTGQSALAAPATSLKVAPQPTVADPAPVRKQAAVQIPVQATPAPVEPSPATPVTKDAVSQPVAVAPAQPERASLTIMDFLGINTAVLLSINGGQSVRTYRVGDTLLHGEVITGIDTQAGTISTTLRTVKK